MINISKSENYEDFVEKFKSKKTTDDCYTPPLVYDAIADWVAKRYELNRDDFVRPFYPGGDYENFNYPENSVVVDNPPFSILAKILDFYYKNKIRFFLFAPTLTLFSKAVLNYTSLPIGADITYDNGAVVNTSFATNLEPHNIIVHTYPDLYQAVHKANALNQKAMKKQLPKYIYPDNVLTSAMAYRYSQYGVEFILPRDQCVQISVLDSQKAVKKGIFGKGFLLSERLAAERLAAERLAAERLAAERLAAERLAAEKWQLSERELKIIEELSKNSAEITAE